MFIYTVQLSLHVYLWKTIAPSKLEVYPNFYIYTSKVLKFKVLLL